MQSRDSTPETDGTRWPKVYIGTHNQTLDNPDTSGSTKTDSF